MRFWLLTAFVFVSASAHAATAEDGAPLGNIEVHGFVSPGYLVTTHGNEYLAKTAERGSFEFTEVGINFSKPLSDRLRIGLQLFSRDLGSLGTYTAKLDWFYLDYRYRDWLGFRAGRVKLPFGLYNDTSDVDVARVPVLLPQSVYPISNRDFLLAQTGGEMYGFLPVGLAGALEYRVFAGTIFLEPSNQAGSPFAVQELGVPYIYGGRLLWETPLPGLRAGGALQALRLDTTLLFSQPPPPVAVDVKIPALLWVGSVEYAAHDLLLAAEYSRWHVEVESTDPLLFPESDSESERAYAMVSYRVGRLIQPGIYYSLYYPDVEKKSGASSQQHDVAATLRFDFEDHWLLKLEGHYMQGTAGLSSTLNGGKSLDDLPDRWGVFLVKTTVHF